MSEELMTEEQWRRREALRQCAVHGHEHEHLIDGTGELLAVICTRCGAHWEVVEG